MPRTPPVLVVLLVLCCGAAPTSAPMPGVKVSLKYRGCHRFADDTLSGLSGTTHLGDDRYVGVLEWDAKLVHLRVTTRGDASIEKVDIDREVPIAKGRDFEGVAFAPARPDSVLVSTEKPALFEVSLRDGRVLRDIPVPTMFDQIVKNQGFESLAFSADGRTLWTANERALPIDGNPKTPATPFLCPTRVRVQRYDVTGSGDATPREQFEYMTSGVHDVAGQIGLCDLAALPDGRLLALERSAAQNLSGVRSIRTRIFLVDVTGATDISRPPFDAGLVDRTPTRVSKTPLYDGFVCDADGENLEGLCLGPPLGDGRWVVLGVVDNTDGGMAVSKSAVVSFELTVDGVAATRPATSH